MAIVFTAPVLTATSAHLWAIVFSLSYVGSLYVSKHTRLSFSRRYRTKNQSGESRFKERDERWRDDPDVIRARLVAVSISTVMSCYLVFVIMSHFSANIGLVSLALESTLERIGLTSLSASEIVLPSLTAPALFLGPLYVCFLQRSLPFQRYWSIRENLLSVVCTWEGWRNYILAPITEELVFRACIIAVYHMSGASLGRMIFLSPLTFGAAHLHHAWDTYNRYGRTMAAARRAMLACFFQFAYTTLFGFHCAFLFLRTGSIIPPIISHVFCNFMGLPGFTADLKRFPQHRKVIINAYVLGIIGYIYTMMRWTDVEDSLYWPKSISPRYY